MKKIKYIFFLVLLLTVGLIACKKDPIPAPTKDKLQLVTAQISGVSLLSGNAMVPGANEIVLGFNRALDIASNDQIKLVDASNNDVSITYKNLDNNKIITLTPSIVLLEGESFSVQISNLLKGENGETFDGLSLFFTIEKVPLAIQSIFADGVELKLNGRVTEVPIEAGFDITFSHQIPLDIIKDNIILIGKKNYDFDIEQIEDFKYRLTPTETLEDLSKLNLLFITSLGTAIQRPFVGVSYPFYTKLDDTPKFPIITDDELLTLVQEQTFKYFWDFGHPISGLARERNTSGETVTSGGSGFGLMSMIVGVERGFITRSQAIERWQKIFNFLENADRFHGVWPHWMNGSTGKVLPFSGMDNGADLVETAFLVQGMLTVRQYLNDGDPTEKNLIDQITQMWEEVEWTWFTRGGQKVLYWHWSPEFEWAINLPIRGHNETQIIYTLAAASPTYPIDKETYIQGYARNGSFQNGNIYYTYELPVGSNLGGPLFFAHYSYLGMDPRNLNDEFVNYWTQNVNHSLINQAYCIDNPLNWVGYSDKCWGLTASDNNGGYSAHSPTNDRGVITPTAAISSLPYTPEASMAAIRHFYYQLGDRLWGAYGFYDAFNPTEGWAASSYLAIDQGPIICMIENHRTALLWDLFMSDTEVQAGLDKLGFTY